MPTRDAIAFWEDKNGPWQGVLQDREGAVPEPLANLCKNWTRLKVRDSNDIETIQAQLAIIEE